MASYKPRSKSDRIPVTAPRPKNVQADPVPNREGMLILPAMSADEREARDVAAGQGLIRRGAADLADMLALPRVDAIMPDGTHHYWSTHCRHGDHELCKGSCKKCGPAAPCICPCHKEGT